MSQFITTTSGNKPVVYGFDLRLQQYFLDVDHCPLVGPLADTYGSAANFIKKCMMLAVMLPNRHISEVSGDLVFSRLTEEEAADKHHIVPTDPAVKVVDMDSGQTAYPSHTELLQKAVELSPNATIRQDGDGQIVIYTNLAYYEGD